MINPESTLASWPAFNQYEATTVDRSVIDESLPPYWKSRGMSFGLETLVIVNVCIR